MSRIIILEKVEAATTLFATCRLEANEIPDRKNLIFCMLHSGLLDRILGHKARRREGASILAGQSYTLYCRRNMSAFLEKQRKQRKRLEHKSLEGTN